MRKLIFLVCGVVFVFSTASCTWVKMTAQGEGVRLLQSARSLESCKRLGNVNSKVVSQIIFDRDADKVAEELSYLARNEAAAMGGDTIVPISNIVDGRRSYAVYQCFQTPGN